MCRYGKNPSLAAIELMNEPSTPGVNLDTLKKYYQAGYNAVRKYTNAYVVLSNRLGPNPNRTELLSFASTLNRVAIDVHYYNLYSEMFEEMNAQQNIDFIYNNRSEQLRDVSKTNGVLSFVGKSKMFFGNDCSLLYTSDHQIVMKIFRRMDWGMVSAGSINGTTTKIC